MKTYIVKTKATVIRHRRVEAENEDHAEALSYESPIVHEEDENEETTSITEEAND